MENSELLNLAREFLDYRDGEFIWIKYAGGQKVGSRAGYLHLNGYRYITFKGKRTIEHRLAYLWHNPEWDFSDSSQEIDHINRIRDDNKIENLRLVTHQENNFNRDARGYYWNKQKQKWMAYININGKMINLGNFDYKTDARLAHVTAKAKYHIIEDRK